MSAVDFVRTHAFVPFNVLQLSTGGIDVTVFPGGALGGLGVTCQSTPLRRRRPPGPAFPPGGALGGLGVTFQSTPLRRRRPPGPPGPTSLPPDQHHWLFS
jgi:hypothetical protein